ncbi:hypothetical protein OPQ81_009897 [Rhizoctonia solani]|nr:hypothetical protein OPQ81_009897 [Rhizoctonia solani]
MGLEMDFSHFMWQDIMESAVGERRSSPAGITSQDFTGTQTRTQAQNDRPLYTLEESYEFLASNDPAELDAVAIDLNILGEEFDLGLGQDAFGDIVPLEDLGPTHPISPTKKSKPKSKGATKLDKNPDPMYAREPSVPFEPLNLDDWAIGFRPSSSGFGLPESGGIGISSRAGSEQRKLRIEVELRRQERDTARVIDVWMEGVPYGFNCPALEGWIKQSFKSLTEDRADRRKRDENDGFAAPPLPKRRREETPSQAPEIGRNDGTTMINFGDEYDWAMGGLGSEIRRGSSVERGMNPSRRASQAPEDFNISQRSGLLPWDNIGISSSTNGDAGPLNFPEKNEHVTVRLRSRSHSGRRSSVGPSRLSASPGRFGPGLEAFGSDVFELVNAVEEQPAQTEVTLERNSFKFLEYARMQTRALSDPSSGVMFSSIAPKESSTAHVAAAAFYHTLVLATKSAVRVKQTEPFGDFAIFTL